MTLSVAVSGASGYAGGEILRRPAEQRPALRVERHTAGGDGTDADQAGHPVGRIGEHLLGRDPAHGVADHRELVPGQLVGQAEHIPADLRDAVLTGDVLARPVTAIVRERVRESLSVDKSGQLAPASRRSEPAVQRHHPMRTSAHCD